MVARPAPERAPSAEAVEFIRFRTRFGNTTVLPTPVWFQGLKQAGSEVHFEVHGKPNTIRLVSIGQEGDGITHIVLSVNNTMHVFPVEMPSHAARQKAGPRIADPDAKGQVASPIMGNVWRIGDKDRTLKVGDIVKKGQEIANIEAMKVENAILSPIRGIIKEIPVRLNEAVIEKQLMMVLEEMPARPSSVKSRPAKEEKKAG